MKQRDIWKVINEFLVCWKLGEKSVRTSSWYVDYASFQFACFPTPAMTNAVERRFKALCNEHGWTECAVTSSTERNAIFVTMMKTSVLPSSDARMEV